MHLLFHSIKKPTDQKVGFLLSLTFGLGLLVFSGCATSDQAKLRESRDAYLVDDFAKSEAALFTPEVFDKSENRLVHFSKLSSIAFSESKYEKSIYYLNKAREVSNQVRSDSGFWDFGGNYRGNPLEYSYYHYYLVMAFSLLADAGQTPAWSTPEIKDKKGTVLVQSQTYAARKFSNKEIADLRIKARAELLAWDTHLQNLKKTFPDKDYYKEDLLARLLASYVHASSNQNHEKRTAELLSQDAVKILQKEYLRYPTMVSEQEKIISLSKKINKSKSLFLIEAGILNSYKVKRFHLGLSTLFKGIKDPLLRSQMEQIGLYVILNTAPEFGLIMVAGGVAGAVSGSEEDEDQIHYFSDAVDRSFGFEIKFPTLSMPPQDSRVLLILKQQGKLVEELELPILSPLQEMLAVELKNRESKEMFAKAITIGAQYLAVLIPAIKAYQQASRENNLLKKMAVIAGYYIAKRAIDAAHQPDLRSWDYLPKMIAGNVLSLPEGEYQASVKISNAQGTTDKDLGAVKLEKNAANLILRRIGDVPLLATPKTKQPVLR